MNDKIGKKAINLLKEIVENGTFFHSAIELEHNYDGEVLEEKIIKLIEEWEVNKELTGSWYEEDIILTTSEGFTFRPRCIRFENQNKLSKEELEEFKRGLEKILYYSLT